MCCVLITKERATTHPYLIGSFQLRQHAPPRSESNAVFCRLETVPVVKQFAYPHPTCVPVALSGTRRRGLGRSSLCEFRFHSVRLSVQVDGMDLKVYTS